MKKTRGLLAMLTGLAMITGAIAVPLNVANADIQYEETQVDKDNNQESTAYVIWYKNVDTIAIAEKASEQTNEYMSTIDNNLHTETELERIQTEYYRKLNRELIKEEIIKRTEVILAELGIDSNNAECSSYAPVIICQLTDEQIEIASECELIESISEYHSLENPHDATETTESSGIYSTMIKGDANLDGKVTVADSVAILQHIAYRDKYELKPQGLINADVDGVDGVTSSDARVIQAQDAFGVFNVQGRDFSSKVDYGSIIANNILKNGEVNGKTSRGCASVITDTDGLKAYLSEICNDKAIEAYEEEYNDEFFEENVLLIDAIAQGSGTFPRLVIKSVDINDIITVEAVWIPQILQEPIMSVCIGQVALSKKAYIGQEVVWTCNNKEVN